MHYNNQEAARYLGVTISDLATARRAKRLSFFRLSERHTVYRKADLDAWRDSWGRHVADATESSDGNQSH